jgi:class 3 adenylate cyclase
MSMILVLPEQPSFFVRSGARQAYQLEKQAEERQLVQQPFDWLRQATVRHGRAMVKTIGHAIMAAYPDAARAAPDVRKSVERFQQQVPDRAMSLKIGLHRWAAIAVTLHGELDVFGQTVNIALYVEEMADAAEIWPTAEVWAYPGVQALLRAYPVDRSTCRVSGHRVPDVGDTDWHLSEAVV